MGKWNGVNQNAEKVAFVDVVTVITYSQWYFT